MNTVLANTTASVTELKRDYANIIKSLDSEPVAILNHNKPEAYLVPAASYEMMIEYIEDLEDARVVRERGDGPFIEVDMDEL
ncbi:MAG: type II toxin-antitoxin system prevent-host-death family antitoxin [Gammaproteobacteria bacterium]|uniref:Antitoxin n=1 Tax=Candidatus Thiopontia autotrophica TaxID=2841688 RepID=A0A8J6P4N8_9GAMM|nr:type II toxin-antitoxin system prevent-host-death family antitoxin [Candidatus Thiopontia autotrophica]